MLSLKERNRLAVLKYRRSEKGIIQNRISQSRRNSIYQERMAKIKLAAGCIDCGYNKCAAALEFDHVRGEKRFELCKGANHAWPIIETEMAKCEIRCANCHAQRTHERYINRGNSP